MPIRLKIDSKTTEEYYAYEPPEPDKLHDAVGHMLNIYKKYLKKRNIKDSEAMYDEKVLANIAVRLDQRCEYFKIYHQNTHLSEMRSIGIVAYWVVKYKPFRIDSEKWQGSLNINEAVAWHMILGMIAKIVYRDPDKELIVSAKYCRKIMHGFKEQDLSKEAFMIIAESLLENVYPVQTNLNNGKR